MQPVEIGARSKSPSYFLIRSFICLLTHLLGCIGRSPIADTMTNWHDPTLEAAEGRSSSSLTDKISRLSLPDSCLHQAFPRRCWRVHVSRLVHSLSLQVDPGSGLPSWELLLNLDYEYSIITRKRKFRWSVPVRAVMALMV
jgi:hypothetical protein